MTPDESESLRIPSAGEGEPPIRFSDDPDETLQQTLASYRAAAPLTAAHAVDKLQLARGYDVPHMDRVVSILFWGRSGSLLLSSYLDGHDETLVMPATTSGLVYKLFAKYPEFSVWEKLIAYPTNFELTFAGDFGEFNQFFGGRFPIEPAEYYAAVHALYQLYGRRDPAWLERRSTFFQLLFVATAVATRRPARNPRPLMVHSQHWFSGEQAAQLLEDFPSAWFIHTVRDPISCFDSWFDHQAAADRFALANLQHRGPHYPQPALDTVRLLTAQDRPQPGAEMRSVALRFEDLHVAPERLMQRVAGFLGILYKTSLLESTFNGTAWANVTRGGTWIGANPANAARRSRNLGIRGRALVSVLMYEEFRTWRYPVRAWLRHGGLRAIGFGAIWLSLWVWPMRMERIGAANAWRQQVRPAIKARRFAYAARSLRSLITCHVRLIILLGREGRRRLPGSPQQLIPI
jgi:Sulfotransferase family